MAVQGGGGKQPETAKGGMQTQVGPFVAILQLGPLRHRVMVRSHPYVASPLKVKNGVLRHAVACLKYPPRCRAPRSSAEHLLRQASAAGAWSLGIYLLELSGDQTRVYDDCRPSGSPFGGLQPLRRPRYYTTLVPENDLIDVF